MSVCVGNRILNLASTVKGALRYFRRFSRSMVMRYKVSFENGAGVHDFFELNEEDIAVGMVRVPARWMEFAETNDFRRICGQWTGIPDDRLLFASEFPAYAFHVLDAVVKERRMARAKYFDMKMPSSRDSNRLTTACAAVAFVSTKSRAFPDFFASFDCVSPLVRVLSLNIEKPAGLAASAISHILDNCPAIAAVVVTEEFVAGLVKDLGLKSPVLQRTLLFCAGSTAGIDRGSGVASMLLDTFIAAAGQPGLLGLALRGMSRLSHHYVHLIVEKECIKNVARYMNLHTITIMNNAVLARPERVVPVLVAEGIMEKIADILTPECAVLQPCLTLLSHLCVDARGMNAFLECDALACTIYNLLLRSANTAKMDIVCFVVDVCERSTVVQEKFLVPEIVENLVDAAGVLTNEIPLRIASLVATRLDRGFYDVSSMEAVRAELAYLEDHMNQ